MKFPIPFGVNITTTNICNGMYELKSNSLERHRFLITNKLAYLTTCENLGRGIRTYLYAFDKHNKSLIRDSAFQRDFLFSSAGIFVIEMSSNMIFAVDKSEWYDSKQENITPASLYVAKGKYFENVKNVYRIEGDDPSDTSLISFFKNSISIGSDRVFPLPDDWWESK